MIVPVLGMHRSGTSALAGLLHRCGVFMGEDRHMKPVPSEENPRGFFENFRFRSLNDRILEECGYEVKAWRPEVPEIPPTEARLRRMEKLLRGYREKCRNWGWKDPRTCLTLPLWLEALSRLDALGECRPVFIVRHPDSVARSMAGRGNGTYEDCLRIWWVYNLTALGSVDGNRLRCLYLRFEDLLGDPLEASRAVTDFLGLPPAPEAAHDSIDRTLNRNPPREPDPEVDPGLLTDVEELRRDLDTRIGSGPCASA